MSKGKYSKNHGFNVRPLVLMLAVALLLGATIGGTIAWLTASTKDVVNTFTVGNINIELKEDNDIAKDNDVNKSFKMVPGDVLDKNPKVTVKGGSEASWVFIKVKKTDNLDSFIAYAIDENWTALGNDYPGIYYKKVAATTSDTEFRILGDGSWTDNKGTTYTWGNDEVLVKSTVTKAMMDALTDATLPKLTFTAAAVQQANIGTGDDAAKAAAAYAELPAEFKN